MKEGAHLQTLQNKIPLLPYYSTTYRIALHSITKMQSHQLKIASLPRKMQSHQLKIASLPKKSPTSVELFVEIVGVEPTTPCLQSRCSSQLSYTPVWIADANMALIFEMCNFYSRICIKSYKVISRKYVCLYL